MDTRHKIQQYITTQSGGKVALTLSQADDIVNIVCSNLYVHTEAVAKLYRHNATSNTWELIRTINTTDEYIKQQIIAALQVSPPPNFYKYELYNSNLEYEGIIYSINASLF